jgi:hypothetical protein
MNGQPLKETRELIGFVAVMASLIGKAMRDGKIDALEMGAILSALVKLPEALAGIGKIPSEMKELTAEQQRALEESFRATFDLPDDVIEEAIEEGVATAFHLFRLITLLERRG